MSNEIAQPEDISRSVMLAFLPVDGSVPFVKERLPHVTIVFCGDYDEHELVRPSGADRSRLTKAVRRIANSYAPIVARRMGVAEIGAFNAHTVLVEHRAFNDIHSRLAVFNASKFAGYVPHLTICYTDGTALQAPQSTYPPKITFDRIALAWGKEITEFPLVGTL